jgi:hypothetical protein
MSTVALTPEQRRLIERREIGRCTSQAQRWTGPTSSLGPTCTNVYATYSSRSRSLDFRCRKASAARKPRSFGFCQSCLMNRRMRGKYSAYHGDERVKVGRSQTEVVRECLKRGLTDDEYDVFVIEPQSRESEDVG